jgi:hypothetical protein
MRTRINQEDYPLMKNESWWVVNPNSSGGEFIVPEGGATACMLNLLDFKVGTVYRVTVETEGWVSVINGEHVVEMPQYLFARHFDAEVFIKGPSKSLISAPTNWKSPIPKKWKD